MPSKNPSMRYRVYEGIAPETRTKTVKEGESIVIGPFTVTPKRSYVTIKGIPRDLEQRASSVNIRSLPPTRATPRARLQHVREDIYNSPLPTYFLPQRKEVYIGDMTITIEPTTRPGRTRTRATSRVRR